MEDTDLLVTIGDTVYPVKTDSDGMASPPLNLTVGEYVAEINYEGTDNYAETTAYANISVKDKFDTVIDAPDVTAVYKDGTKLVATLKDENGNAISGEKVKFVISGGLTKYVRTDANGEAAISLASLDVGTYKATITFVATDLYNKSSTTANITINEA